MKSEDYAYLIIIFFLFFFFYKINSRRFPGENRNQVLAFYKGLLNHEEYESLFAIIENYSLKSLNKYLLYKQKLRLHEEKETEEDKHNIKPGDFVFEEHLFYEIVSQDHFVKSIANKHPYFFANIIRTFNYRDFYNQDLLHIVIYTFLKARNRFLFKELKECIDSEQELSSDKIILFSLLGDLRVMKKNIGWKPFGDYGKLFLSRIPENHFFNEVPEGLIDLEEELWKYEIYPIIYFFHLMVTKEIKSKGKHHMWLYYYDRFIEIIVKNLPSNREIDWNKEYPIISLKVLKEILRNLYDWFEISYEYNNPNLIEPITKCCIRCLVIICRSPMIVDKFKCEIVNGFLETYCKNYYISENDNNETVQSIRKYVIHYLNNPPIYLDGSESLKEILKLTWNTGESDGGFDKMTDFENNEAINSLDKFVFANDNQ